MAVDILVSNPEESPCGHGLSRGDGLFPEPRARFDDDAYYWFMWPLFETLAQRTGQFIDIYGDAAFRGDSLTALRETLSEARRLVLAKPDTWEVMVGWTDKSRKQERYATARRADFICLLDDFQRVVGQAEQLGSSVVCLGD